MVLNNPDAKTEVFLRVWGEEKKSSLDKMKPQLDIENWIVHTGFFAFHKQLKACFSLAIVLGKALSQALGFPLEYPSTLLASLLIL